MPANTSISFILRTPLLKLTDLVHTENQLLEAYRIPTIRQALYIASADLYNELQKYEKGEVQDDGKRTKMFISLYKYYTRMCTRSTPFGYFSGINTGEFGDHTEISLFGRHHAHIRLDMDYLCRLYNQVMADVSLYPSLTFFPNSTLYEVHDQLRYVEYRFREDEIRVHNLVSVDNNEVLTKIIENSNAGASIDTLTAMIMDYGFDRVEATRYLYELIQSQVLISNLYPSVTGPEYQFRLFSVLGAIDPEKYRHIHDTVFEILSGPLDIISKINQTEEILSPFRIKTNANRLLQIDLLKEANTCTLDAAIIGRIREATKVVASLMISKNEHQTLENFKWAFYERYEDAFMPLNKVMDTDIGIGYKNAISTTRHKKGETLNMHEKKIRSLKLNLYTRAIQTGATSVELQESEVAPYFGKQQFPIPAAYAFMGRIINTKENEVLINFKHAGGSSANALLGRFGHLSPEMEALCKTVAEREEALYSNVILAEILHFPLGRIGNVLARPHFRKYEIPYLSFSTLPETQQIPIDDIYVGVQHFRVVLYSKKHNREIIPRLGSAHNFQYDSLPVYNFLCDLQHQNSCNSVFWSWDELYDQPFLPRITYKNIILSSARWQIFTKQFLASQAEGGPEAVRQKLRSLKIPDVFLLSQGDNELYIDIRHNLALQTFLSYCRKNDYLTLEEFLYTEETTVAGHTNEIVVPFFDPVAKPYEGLKDIDVAPAGNRTLDPFSTCVFFKLFTGKKFAEKLLNEVIPEMVSTLKKRQIIGKWFFIRYADPKEHLRIRFFMISADKRVELMDVVNEYLNAYIAQEIIWDIQVSTYKRELDRYGRQTMEESEELFCLDSELVLKLLPLMKTLTENKKVIAVLYGVDKMLELFGHNLAGKREFTDRQSAFFNKEFGVDANKSSRLHLNDEFRRNHDGIIGFLEDEGTNDDVVLRIRQAYQDAEAGFADIINEIIAKHKDDPSKLEGMTASYIHMFVNRAFPTDQRYKEMVIYYHLLKYYSTYNARKKANIKPAKTLI